MDSLPQQHDVSSLMERITRAARLAVIEHLHQSAASDYKQGTRQVTIGGAGPGWVTDDSLSVPHDRAIHSNRASRLAEGEVG